MNIEEAKEKLHSMAYRDLQTKPYDLKLADVMQILNQIELNQPKPVVPQLVIDWVDDSKERDYDFDEWFDCDNQSLGVYKWLNHKNKRQADINALALVTLIVNGPDAVKVEQEKLYTVEIPNPNIIGNEHTVLMKNGFGQIVMLRVYGDDWRTDKGYQNTESKIRKDFDWAWKEGFMKEVTE